MDPLEGGVHGARCHEHEKRARVRKPAVVVTVAVSAVLVGGVMVATTAGAETTSEAPPVPSMVISDVPMVPQLPPDAGVPAAAGSDASGLPGTDAPGVTGVPDLPGTDDPAVPTREPAARPGGSPAAKPDRPQDEPDLAPSTRPAPAPDADKPQKNTASAQRDVTAAQALSADPRGDVQQQALRLVNEHRRRGGCDDLTADRRLIAAANRHAADMARRGYFAHEDGNGDRAGERVRAAGYEWSRYGENIARGQDSVYEVVDGWMHSPEHRENIMDCRLHQVGLGLAFSPDRTPYWVQDFATPL
ncbi:CAP domain-containing protein [Actinoplanes sp. NPDC049548]|uniref:CAP domain-containing protein n=1 Tax=Actinoplanes sp. NPDC049548 TaxID=3155152 RepID=UPI003441A31D